MQQPAQPWRVFDETPRHGAVAAAAGAQEAPADPQQRPMPAIPLAPLAAIVAAAAIAAVAAAIAIGGPHGEVVGPGSADAAASWGDGTSLVVVDVAGAVVKPGVYRLPTGSRVGDAIAAAGGFSPRVAAAAVDRGLNLAAVLQDGERIVVPSRDVPDPGAASGQPGPGASASLIDLNTATQAELESLPGIGPVTAGKIIEARAEAPFRTIDELRDRKLVGPATFEKIRELIRAS